MKSQEEVNKILLKKLRGIVKITVGVWNDGEHNNWFNDTQIFEMLRGMMNEITKELEVPEESVNIGDRVLILEIGNHLCEYGTVMHDAKDFGAGIRPDSMKDTNNWYPMDRGGVSRYREGA